MVSSPFFLFEHGQRAVSRFGPPAMGSHNMFAQRSRQRPRGLVLRGSSRPVGKVRARSRSAHRREAIECRAGRAAVCRRRLHRDVAGAPRPQEL